MQIIVFSDKITPRVQYIFNHILNKMLGFDVLYVQQVNDIERYSQPKIAYSQIKINNCINIKPHGLLFDNGIIEQSFEIVQWNSLPVFFSTDNHSDIPFDIFAASFFLITRYEEYLPHKPDIHGRFSATESLANKHNFLGIPIVDLWVKELAKSIKSHFPDADIKKPNFNFLPTIDIDNAYAYRHKGFVRSFLGLGKSLLALNLQDLIRRKLTLLRILKDPFDTYNALFKILEPYPESKWFILGGEMGEFDRNIDLGSNAAQKLINDITTRYTLGAHPSYKSVDSDQILASEIELLAKFSGNPITHSRQHYLRFNLPNTYRLLDQLGVKFDYSMGYSNYNGFRAGTCTSFNFYDLIAEKELSLIIVPFQIMDRALLQSFKHNPSQAVEFTINMAAMVKTVGGTFVTVWHNETLSGNNEWKGWEDVLSKIILGVKGLD